MELTAKETYKLVQKSLLSYGYDDTYMTERDIITTSGTEQYLKKAEMLALVKETGGLDANTMTFLNKAFVTMSLNTCNSTENVVEKQEIIKLSNIHTVFCIKFGDEYVQEMIKAAQ